MIMSLFRPFLFWKVFDKIVFNVFKYNIELADPNIKDVREELKKYGNENPGKKYYEEL